MHYDGVSVVHKANSVSKATNPKKRIWRERGQGLKIPSKGRKEGNNGKYVRIFVGISYTKGIVMCGQFDSDIHFDAKSYRDFVNIYCCD